MSSDPKNHFSFLVDEISERWHTGYKMANLSILFRTILHKPNSKYSVNEFRLKASFKTIESILCF